MASTEGPNEGSILASSEFKEEMKFEPELEPFGELTMKSYKREKSQFKQIRGSVDDASSEVSENTG